MRVTGSGGVGEEPLGQQQAMGLRELERRDAELALEHPAEMAVAHTELAGELPDAAAVERARADPVGRDPCEAGDGIDDRPAGRELGPAAQTRPKAGPLSGGRGVEEPAPVVIRNAGRAHRPAVDPGGGDADEEQAVEPGVAASRARARRRSR